MNVPELSAYTRKTLTRRRFLAASALAVLATLRPAQVLAQGKRVVIVGAGLRTSALGFCNRRDWTCCLRGDRARWPDVY